MAPTLHHLALKAVLEGTQTSFGDSRVVHYRGIKYGVIGSRFQKAELVDDWKNVKLDCTKFGPQCPQSKIDVENLLRVPGDHHENREQIEHDEKDCLNLNISLPEGNTGNNSLLPVLVWIHGGAQVVSYPPVAHKATDVTPLIARSASIGNPIMVVTFNYRLNIFGFGNGQEKNLALKDQRLALEWIFKHIGGFGGDKNNITLAGESAGALYTNAHVSHGNTIRRAILQSGSLYLSPPLPVERGTALINKLNDWLTKRYNTDLETESVENVLEMLDENNITTLWIQEEPDLLGWQERGTQVKELLIGDVEYESVIWRNGLETATAEEITSAFDSDTEFGSELREMYGVFLDRATSSKNGALDFITDIKFALPAEDISRQRRIRGQKTYQYVFDQANPWQSSSRAHHVVDLIFLFGNYDLSFNPAAAKVAEQIQERWIRFVSGEAPFNEGKRFAFGPFGKCGEIDEEEFAARRRTKHFELLRKVDPASLAAILGKLAAGRMSLLN